VQTGLLQRQAGLPDDAMLINRIGTFFVLMGLGLIGMFVLSDIAKAPTCNLLIFGAISLGLGVFLWMRDPTPPPQQTGRFRILRSGGKKPEKKK
jgi:hypothetical protein